MKMLEESTAEKPATLRIFFYGQSIVAQPWTDIVINELKQRYPTVNLQYTKKAIGGFTSPHLLRCSYNDLYPWNPDLLFFHVYGPLDKYEEIIRNVRATTAAEIILWTSHLDADTPKDAQDMLAHRDERSLGIQELGRKYHCMVIDLNQKWCNYLLWENISRKRLLKDNIHLNQDGINLYAQCIKEELLRIPELGDNPTAAGTISFIPASEIKNDENGNATITFTGNRIVAVSNGKGNNSKTAQLLLDGKPAIDQKELWSLTRTTEGPFIWTPAIKNVSFDATPKLEKWKIICLPDSDKNGARIHFKVLGTQTGEDGEGYSDADFVSNSRRIVIDKDDWFVAGPLKTFKKDLPENFTIMLDSYPQFALPYTPQPVAKRILLIQGCSAAKHTLTFQGISAEELGIDLFQVNCPPPQEKADDTVPANE